MEERCINSGGVVGFDSHHVESGHAIIAVGVYVVGVHQRRLDLERISWGLAALLVSR